MPDHLVEQFKTKTYYAEETIVISFLGHVCKLEDLSLFHLLRLGHYILINKSDMTSNEALTQKVNMFAKNAELKWSQYLHEFTTTLVALIRPRPEDQTLLLDYYLSNLFGDDKQLISKLKSIFNLNEQQFADELIVKIENKYRNQGLTKILNPNLISEVSALAANLQIDSKKHAFVEKQAQRLLANKNTFPIVTSVLVKDQFKIIIASNKKKLGDISGDPTYRSAGRASTPQNLVYVFFGGFYNEFPDVSLLGGLAFAGPPLTACTGKDGNQRGVESHAPFIRTLAEETFDFFLAYQKEAKTKINILLAQYSHFLMTLDKQVQEQAEVIELVLAKKSLSSEQKKLWKKMLEEAQNIYKLAEPTPASLLANTPKYPIGSPYTLQVHGIDLNFTLKRFLEPSELNCLLPENEYVSHWETSAVKTKLTRMQVASLYKWFLTSYSMITESVKGYSKAHNPLHETLGKLFAYYVFAPGYIEVFLPKLHEIYETLYQNSEDLNVLDRDISICVGEMCYRHSIVNIPDLGLTWDVGNLGIIQSDITNQTVAEPKKIQKAVQVSTTHSNGSLLNAAAQRGTALLKSVNNAWRFLRDNLFTTAQIDSSAPQNESTQQAHDAKSITTNYRVTTKEGITTLEFKGPNYTVNVFAKRADTAEINTLISTKNLFPINSDTYSVSSCVPIEFEGKPAVYCEGKVTTMVYTPHLSPPPLQNLDANIMLGAVVVHHIHQYLQPKSAEIPSKLLSSKGYQRAIRHCLTRLTELEMLFQQTTNSALALNLQNLCEDLNDLVAKRQATKQDIENIIDQADALKVHLKHEMRWHEEEFIELPQTTVVIDTTKVPLGTVNNFFQAVKPVKGLQVATPVEIANTSNVILKHS